MLIKAPDDWFIGFVGRPQINNWVEPRRAPRPPQPMAAPEPAPFNWPRAADLERLRLAAAAQERRFREEQARRIEEWNNPRGVARPVRHDDVLQPDQGMFQFTGPFTYTTAPFDDGREITKEDIV